MTWKIAQAKQHFSQLIRAAADEPQFISNRNRPVAAVIGGETFALFATWRSRRSPSPPQRSTTCRWSPATSRTSRAVESRS